MYMCIYIVVIQEIPQDYHVNRLCQSGINMKKVFFNSTFHFQKDLVKTCSGRPEISINLEKNSSVTDSVKKESENQFVNVLFSLKWQDHHSKRLNILLLKRYGPDLNNSGRLKTSCNPDKNACVGEDVKEEPETSTREGATRLGMARLS